LALVLVRPDLCGMDIRLDRFRDEIVFALPDAPQAWLPLTDADYTRLRIALERLGFRPVGRELMRDAVLMVAEDRPFDSAIEWLEGLAWDGVPRVAGFFAGYFGCGDSPYALALSRYLWSAMAGRLLSPGIKADMVPVLVGVQGSRKSSGVAAMLPDDGMFCEVSFHEKEDDLSRKLRGCLVAEIAELQGLRTRELEGIKAFITRTHEKWVPKYREFATSYARRNVFVGTTNQEQFLADETGNRRWCPIRTGVVDVAAVARDRLQLWAEGRLLFLEHGVCWQDAERLAAGMHEAHMVSEQWQEEIERWLDEPDLLTGEAPRERLLLQTADIASQCLKIEARFKKRGDEMQIAKVMKKLGYCLSVTKIGTHSVRVWRK